MNHLPAFKVVCRCGEPARPWSGIGHIPETCAACQREDVLTWKRDWNAKRKVRRADARADRVPSTKPQTTKGARYRRRVMERAGMVACPRRCGAQMYRLTVNGTERVACPACLERDRAQRFVGRAA